MISDTWKIQLDEVMTRAASAALLLAPRTIEARLGAGEAQAVIEQAPTRWQLAQGVVRMLHRMWTRPESIGLSADAPVRSGPLTRLMRFRPVRAPLLLGLGAVQPWDLTGLLADRDRLVRHLVGTHHDRRQFAYDLEILRLHPAGLEALRDEARAIVEGQHPKAALFRQTCVYEGYHERLLEAAEAALEGELRLDGDEARDPDISFGAYLAWCAAQPRTVAASLARWRALGLEAAFAPLSQTSTTGEQAA